jgi:hypothetical protein
MPSLLRPPSIAKQTGQVYTPQWLVSRILDEAGYVGEAIGQWRLLDPACGDGQFLVEAVRRIQSTLPQEKWENAFASLEGWDIDENALNICRDRLNALIAPKTFPWKLQKVDSLTQYGLTSASAKYDIVVGNPPYIRIQHLPASYKRFLQKNFIFCRRGSTDVYLAFFELGLSLLTQEGRLAFITPNSYLYTDAGRDFREYILSHRLLCKIIDFDSQQVFPGVTVYTCITVLSKSPARQWIYTREGYFSRMVPYTHPTQDILSEIAKLPISEANKEVPLDSVAHIGVGLTTLADRIFILEPIDHLTQSNYISLRNGYGKVYQLEKALLRPILKVSTYHGEPNPPIRYIVFPYIEIEGRFRLINEEELASCYPYVYTYLLQYRTILEHRDGGRSNPEGWYALGRHQNLEASFGAKIVFPPLAQKPTFYLAPWPEWTMYAGYFIRPKPELTKLVSDPHTFLLEQLLSPRMKTYFELLGKPFKNGWRAQNKRLVAKFPIHLP